MGINIYTVIMMLRMPVMRALLLYPFLLVRGKSNWNTVLLCDRCSGATTMPVSGQAMVPYGITIGVQVFFMIRFG
jgi:hypothetical protein